MAEPTGEGARLPWPVWLVVKRVNKKIPFPPGSAETPGKASEYHGRGGGAITAKAKTLA
jgi:hypothetical protein